MSVHVEVKEKSGPVLKTLQEIMKGARGKYVKVGVLYGEKERSVSFGKLFKKELKKSGSISKRIAKVSKTAAKHARNIELATYHEFGAPRAGIPERSFIRSTYDANKEKYIEMLTKLLGSHVLEGTMSLRRAYELVGAKAAADIKKRVTQGAQIPPPNKEATMKRKLDKSYGKRKLGPAVEPRTLVDTGQMINSISWEYVGGGR